MTTGRAKEVVNNAFGAWYSEYIGCESYNATEAEEARDAALKALDEVEKYKQIIDDIKDIFIDSLIFGELWDFKNDKISDDDVIHEMNRVFKNEITQAINKHLKGERLCGKQY